MLLLRSIVRPLGRLHALPYKVGNSDRFASRKPTHHHPVIVADSHGQGCVERPNVQVNFVNLLVSRLFGMKTRRSRVAYRHAIFTRIRFG
jgi:hypothetical protein